MAKQPQYNVVGMRSFKTKAVEEMEDIAPKYTEVDPFQPYYGLHGIIEPPYRFLSLYRLYEESDILRASISAYTVNIEGFGYRLDFLGEDKFKDGADAQKQFATVKNFFDMPNNDYSFLSLRARLRKDYEILGQAVAEVTRFRSGGIAAFYHMPMIDVRMTQLDTTPVTIVSQFYREGRWRKVNIKKRFRKFVQVQNDGVSLKWFKQLGDPRIMDAVTGEFVSSRKEAQEVASEVMLFQQPTGGRTYALPRWIANAVDIAGRRNIEFINYDISNSQGIPPLMVIVENGALSDESREDLQAWADSMRGPENFNRIGLLEAIPEMHGLDDKGTVKITLKSLAGDRSQDLMFSKYLEATEQTVLQSFRLPPLFLGNLGEGISYASSYIIQRTTEAQVFGPERISFDEQINYQIVRKELGSDLWKFTSLGPQIASSEEFRLSLKELNAAGAISINTAIDMMNEILGTSVSKIDDDYANAPLVLLKTMSNQGSFTLPGIANAVPTTPAKKIPGTAGAPETTGAPLVPTSSTPSATR